MGFDVEEQENIEQHLKTQNTNSAMRVAGLFFFLVMILELPLSLLVVQMGRMVSAEYYSFVSVLITQGYLLVCGLCYVLLTKKSLGKDLAMQRHKVSSFFLSLILLVCASPMAVWLNMLSQLFAKNEISNSIYEITQVVPMWMGILVIGCLPGFVEEFLFRGILYSAFRKRSVLTAVLVSAFAFGLMHMNFNQIMYAVYLGVIFALVLEATGSLFSTMVLHGLFNAWNTAYVYILPKLYEFLGQYASEYADMDVEQAMNATVSKQEILTSLLLVAPVAVAGLVLTVLLLCAIAKINGRDISWSYMCGERDEVRQTKPVNIPLLFGFAFCIAVALGNL